MICLTRQSLEAARFATDDETKHAAVLKKALDIVREKGFTVIPPIVAQEIQRIIRNETGNADPYSVQKRVSNDLMLGILERIRQQIRASETPLPLAVKFAIAGNTIDYAVRGDWNKETLLQAFNASVQEPINGNIESFTEAIKQAKRILYFLDNCGEIVCDLLLIEEIKRFRPDAEIVAVVRGSAVLNDATLADAKQVMFDKVVPVIANGNDAVGTVLEQCSSELMDTLHQSDTIIAKGLANYETLIEYGTEQLPQAICYLFKAKCSFIAKYAGVKLGDAVVRVCHSGEQNME
jgi:uncharacterized protein with ATP-grasp and redox domains